MENRQKAAVYIEPEHVIVNLLAEDENRYLRMSRLFHFVFYLRQQLIERQDILKNSRVVFDISFDSVERTVRHRNNVFDLYGETILLRCAKNELSTKINRNDLPDDIRRFIKETAKTYVRDVAA